MRKLVTGAVLALIFAGSAPIATAPAQAVKGGGGSPKAVCATLAEQEPDLYQFIATKPGACESSVASVGMEALLQGAFPSQASAVGNCKMLETEISYPYSFYGDLFSTVEGAAFFLQQVGLPPELAALVVANYAANIDAFTAKNRAGCVTVLKGLHSGELFGLLLPGAPG